MCIYVWHLRAAFLENFRSHGRKVISLFLPNGGQPRGALFLYLWSLHPPLPMSSNRTPHTPWLPTVGTTEILSLAVLRHIVVFEMIIYIFFLQLLGCGEELSICSRWNYWTTCTQRSRNGFEGQSSLSLYQMILKTTPPSQTLPNTSLPNKEHPPKTWEVTLTWADLAFPRNVHGADAGWLSSRGLAAWEFLGPTFSEADLWERTEIRVHRGTAAWRVHWMGRCARMKAAGRCWRWKSRVGKGQFSCWWLPEWLVRTHALRPSSCLQGKGKRRETVSTELQDSPGLQKEGQGSAWQGRGYRGYQVGHSLGASLVKKKKKDIVVEMLIFESFLLWRANLWKMTSLGLSVQALLLVFIGYSAGLTGA